MACHPPRPVPGQILAFAPDADSHELAGAPSGSVLPGGHGGLAGVQQVALLANALHVPGLISTESRRLERWIDILAAETAAAAS